ncbi:MAG: DUF523 domain-containing protein, partial [Planctomycetota bacterium]|nr:DUF523 domain-containing protein [Planctomycetota bacterium]
MNHDHPRPRLAVSACLLGRNVRYDGGHSQDRYLTGELGPHVEWVPVCPEIEAGLGKPRPAIHLSEAPGEASADRDQDRLLTRAGVEVTPAVRAACQRILDSLGPVDGFLLKRASPSCGPFRQTVYRQTPDGGRMPSRKDAGLFARAARELFVERGLELAIEDEGRLGDPDLRLFFATRVFAAARWRALREQLLGPATTARSVRREVERFHAAHKYLLLIHDEPTCRGGGGRGGGAAGRGRAGPPPRGAGGGGG